MGISDDIFLIMVISFNLFKFYFVSLRKTWHINVLEIIRIVINAVYVQTSCILQFTDTCATMVKTLSPPTFSHVFQYPLVVLSYA